MAINLVSLVMQFLTPDMIGRGHHRRNTRNLGRVEQGGCTTQWSAKAG